LRENTKENLFFSPYGIASVLAMAHAGARGETADEMAKTLSFSLKQDEIPGAYRSLLGATLHPDRPGCELNVANRFWCQQGYRFRQPFLDALHDQFQSGITEVDFRQSDAVTKEMNDWIDEKTKHRIQDAVHPGAINSETRFSIVNAVYFKGKWEESFPKQDTKDMPFFAEREQIQVPMMVLGESSNRYADIDNVQILEKSYLGGDVSMLILLPRKNIKTLDQLESTLTEEKLVEWNKSLQDRDVDVFLPRFTMSTEYQLPGVLGKMGMKKAFLLASADFSGMTETREPLALDQILHKTFLKIDEEGTEAVAVTVVGGMGGMTPVKKTPIFRADHPFLFMIRDTRTGCILFMGRVMNPPVEKGASEKQGMGMY
jgi:serpin B